MSERERLSPEDWISAGLVALAEGGIAAVRVDPIARALKMTRGSFYWHFRDRQALLDALVTAWRDRQTDDVVAGVERASLPPEEALRALLRICFDDDGRLEKAFRAWASQSDAVQAAVREVDRRRLDYLAKLLGRTGVSDERARVRARIAYRTWLGEYALANRSDGGTSRADADELHALLLS
ncbi:MAG: TetR/AcrR family transcriptional regulator [Pseudomonadota bacterium]